MSRLTHCFLIFLVTLPGTSCSIFDSIGESLASVCAEPIYVVNSTSPDKDGICTADNCTLRDAIATASVCEGDKTIRLASATTYTLERIDNITDGENALPVIEGRITIEGNNASIQARRYEERNIGRLFYIKDNGNLSIENVTVSNGIAFDCLTCGSPVARDSKYNGGCFINNGRLTLNNVRTINCVADWKGGAIYNTGILSVNNSQFTYNRMSFEGGGSGSTIFNEAGASVQVALSKFLRNSVEAGGGTVVNLGNMQIYTTEILDNHAETKGGGLLNLGDVVIHNSTIADNDADSWGGGLFNEGNARIELSTISGNSVPNLAGAGIFNSGLLEIIETTIYENQILTDTNPETGAGIQTATGATTTSTGSIVANNQGGRDCNTLGTLQTSGTPNLDSDNSCEDFTLHRDPLLGRIRYNGGPTRTHVPVPTSPAIDTGGTNCSVYDQRGNPFRRRIDGNNDSAQECDLGATEYQGG